MIEMQSLNAVDYIFLAIFFISIVAGLGRGFFKEIFSLLTLVAAFAVAIMFSNPLALKFASTPGMDGDVSNAVSAGAAQPLSYMAIGVSFSVLFAATILIGTLLGYVLNMIFQTGVLGIGNRIMGGAFGLIRGLVLCLVFIFLVQLTPYGEEAWWKASKVVSALQPSVEWVDQLISPEFAKLKEKVGKSMEGTKEKVEESEPDTATISAPVQDLTSGIVTDSESIPKSE